MSRTDGGGLKDGWAYVLRRMFKSRDAQGNDGYCPSSKGLAWVGSVTTGPDLKVDGQGSTTKTFTGTLVESDLVLRAKNSDRQEYGYVWNPVALWMLYPSPVGQSLQNTFPSHGDSFVISPLINNTQGAVYIQDFDGSSAPVLKNKNDASTEDSLYFTYLDGGYVQLKSYFKSNSTDKFLGLEDSGPQFGNKGGDEHTLVRLERVWVSTSCASSMTSAAYNCSGNLNPSSSAQGGLFCCTASGKCSVSDATGEGGGQAFCPDCVSQPMVTSFLNCGECAVQRSGPPCGYCTSSWNPSSIACSGASSSTSVTTTSPFQYTQSMASAFSSFDAFAPTYPLVVPPSQNTNLRPPPPVYFTTPSGQSVAQQIGGCGCPYGSTLLAPQNGQNAVCSVCRPGTCYNGGLCDVGSGKCICPEGYYGDRCQYKSSDNDNGGGGKSMPLWEQIAIGVGITGLLILGLSIANKKSRQRRIEEENEFRELAANDAILKTSFATMPSSFSSSSSAPSSSKSNSTPRK